MAAQTMTKFERLAKRLYGMFGYELTNFKRTYASKDMKKAGAFVWEARLGNMTVGSCWTVTELLRAKNITQEHCGWHEIELFPE